MANEPDAHEIPTVRNGVPIDGEPLAISALQALIDAVDEGLLFVDREGRLVTANARLWRMFDVDPVSSLAELRSHIVGCMADPEGYLEQVEADGAAGSETVESDLALVRPVHGVLRRRVSAVRDGDGTLVGRLVSYRDVTRDAEMNRLKSEFVASVSHELRTPMAAIKGFLDVVLDDEEEMPGEQRRHFLEIAREQTHRLSRLIDDLLDISRIESGRRVRKERAFAVAGLLSDVVFSVRAEAASAGLRLEVDEPDPDWRLVADRDQIAQVLFNLLSNAIKFTLPGGRVSVQPGDAEGELRVSVSDTGCGITMADLPHIFERFYRCRNAGAAPAGTGLGLSIARELAEGHGGRIEVVSEPSLGSTFTLCLPWPRPEELP